MALQDYFDKALRVLHTGSRVICDPPVMNTDDDYLLLIHPVRQWEIRGDLANDGYFGGGSLVAEGLRPLSIKPDYSERWNGSTYRSYKKGNINIILTCDPDYFENFRCSTLLAKKLNLRNKADRVALFEAINFDEWPEYEGIVIK